MTEQLFTAAQVQQAVYDVLDDNCVSLWLQEPQDDTTTPFGLVHPEDVGHIGRWVIERLRG
ncbi:hypothetical protein L3Y19_gp121 [Gordonia phage Neville]|uniref:Uncharacterized protein n=2 Tax=Nevillevirus TaxID=3044773 RepID=A0A515MH45_9CAUD|nr:hypothetical protein L3Y19_gp121 [Gordonia phage Neville]YP_010246089.1 hypothetical protein L3Y20_gp121 [Gordonia phage Trax]AXQ64466.1 hypothetical protein SEA_NEVILLE_109 [Gordonia phage Neville]QDM55991.1 hypothetical protein SEA_TRAX_111 [Gordonia phage Trax]